MALGLHNQVLLWPLDERTQDKTKPFLSFTDHRTIINDVKFMADGQLVPASRDGELYVNRYEPGYGSRQLLPTIESAEVKLIATYGSEVAAVDANGVLRR